LELYIAGGLGRRLRTDSASPHYGLIDRVTAYMAKTFPRTLMRSSPDGTVEPHRQETLDLRDTRPVSDAPP
jgi:hypothetical protein